jgi:hypothetical protein
VTSPATPARRAPRERHPDIVRSAVLTDGADPMRSPAQAGTAVATGPTRRSVPSAVRLAPSLSHSKPEYRATLCFTNENIRYVLF